MRTRVSTKSSFLLTNKIIRDLKINKNNEFCDDEKGEVFLCSNIELKT